MYSGGSASTISSEKSTRQRVKEPKHRARYTAIEICRIVELRERKISWEMIASEVGRSIPSVKWVWYGRPQLNEQKEAPSWDKFHREIDWSACPMAKMYGVR